MEFDFDVQVTLNLSSQVGAYGEMVFIILSFFVVVLSSLHCHTHLCVHTGREGGREGGRREVGRGE